MQSDPMGISGRLVVCNVLSNILLSVSLEMSGM